MDFNHVQCLVFGGGGVHGISYIGVLESLYKKFNFDCFSPSRSIHQISGVSVGAFIGFFLACGFDYIDDMHVVLREFIQKSLVCINPFEFFSVW